MLKFCPLCGAALGPSSKFCPACGCASDPRAAAISTPRDQTINRPSPKSGGPILLISVAIVAALTVTVGGTWQLGWIGTSGADAAQSIPVAATENTDAARPKSWFDGYTDKFRSAGVAQFVTGTAQKRDYPTSKGSTVLATLQPGARIQGRWVEGADPTTKWFKTAEGGYIWEGNLSSEDEITPFGMLGMVVSMTNSEMSERLSPVGKYGAQTANWDSIACETYPSRDGKAEVMVLQGKAGAFVTTDNTLRTREGIRVGSTELELKSAYGGNLLRKENPYEGADYFVWAKPDRGIKFSVSDDLVKAITSGNKAIEYVEGCL